MTCLTDAELKSILDFFALPGAFKSASEYGNGHINSTVRLVYDENGEEKHYILQKLNSFVFHDPEALMRNTVAVTEHLRKKIAARGGDPLRETITALPGRNGAYLCSDANGGRWRLERFLTGTFTFDFADNPALMRETGLAFGTFLSDLSDFPAETLADVLPGFHDTGARFNRFKEVLAADTADRARTCKDETDFLLSRKPLARFLSNGAAGGRSLPLRVTHNDTKINNLLFNEKTGRAECVIDLDTVMPGYVMHDFGDAIRSGACTAAEDEPDVSKVALDLAMYEAYADGFLEAAARCLCPAEYETLAMGPLVITCEQALRFLTDYLEGDPYYKTAFPTHNLVRARTQIALLRSMEANRAAMADAVRRRRESLRGM